MYVKGRKEFKAGRSVPTLGICAGRKMVGLTWPLHCSGADTGGSMGGSSTDTVVFYNEGLVLTVDDIEKDSECCQVIK